MCTHHSSRNTSLKLPPSSELSENIVKTLELTDAIKHAHTPSEDGFNRIRNAISNFLNSAIIYTCEIMEDREMSSVGFSPRTACEIVRELRESKSKVDATHFKAENSLLAKIAKPFPLGSLSIGRKLECLATPLLSTVLALEALMPFEELEFLVDDLKQESFEVLNPKAAQA